MLSERVGCEAHCRQGGVAACATLRVRARCNSPRDPADRVLTQARAAAAPSHPPPRPGARSRRPRCGTLRWGVGRCSARDSGAGSGSVDQSRRPSRQGQLQASGGSKVAVDGPPTYPRLAYVVPRDGIDVGFESEVLRELIHCRGRHTGRLRFVLTDQRALEQRSP